MKWLAIVALVIVTLIVGDRGLSEMIQLKNGTTIRGSIKEMNEAEVVLETVELGVVKFNDVTIFFHT